MSKSVIRARPVALGLAVAVAFLVTVPASAGPHRARMSGDLVSELAAGSQSIRVIVHGTKAETDALAARYNVRVARTLKTGAVLVVNAGQLAALRDDEGVDHLSADIRLHSFVDATTAASIGADQLWADAPTVRRQMTPRITVAVIDSGIDTNHDALKGRVLYTRDFTGGDGVDRFGHGTHVAAIIAGQAGRTPDLMTFRGIAPDANLINLRVLGADGSGLASDVIEAIDWAIEHRHEYNLRVINLSLGAPVTQPYRDDPVCEAVERAYRAGLVVVAAAGNYGRTADGKSVNGMIASPGNSPYAITVGAIDTHDTAALSDDSLAPYSSKGPTAYDLGIKPDVSAPGTRIVSAESGGGYLSTTYPARHVGGSGPSASMQLSGTSMAAAVVSGTVALLLDARESLTPWDTRAVLQLTSTFIPSAGIMGAGAGMVNVAAAAELVKADQLVAMSRLVGEDVVARGLWTRLLTPHGAISQGVKTFWDPISGHAILRASFAGDNIIWGSSSSDNIIWGSSSHDTIIWGSWVSDTIIWGSWFSDTIIWGSWLSDTIIWGSVY